MFDEETKSCACDNCNHAECACAAAPKASPGCQCEAPRAPRVEGAAATMGSTVVRVTRA